MKNLKPFKRGESKEVYNKLSKTEKEEIEDFIKYVSITSKSEKRLSNNRISLLTFRKVISKPLSKTTLQDLRNFLALLNSSKRTQSSRNELKATIKRFLKWRFKDWSERFNDLSDIKLIIKMNEEKINSSTLLKREDITKIMEEEKSIFWKTFFINLYESGLRPIELRTLTWDRIKFDIEDDLSEINIYATKTSKARSVYVQEGTYWLKRLKEESDIKNPLVFPSYKDKNKPISKEAVAVWLKRISKRALKRAVNPYLLRHTRATELYKNANIPDKTAQKFLGHSMSMANVYTHLSSDDVKEALTKTIYNKKQLITKQKKHELEEKIEFLEKRLRETQLEQKNDREELKSIIRSFKELTKNLQNKI